MRKYLLLIATLLSVSIGSSSIVYADDTGNKESQQTQAEYSVIPELSKHQNKNINGYFDMTWAPGEEGEIGLTIVNNTKNDKTFTINVNKALTNANGALVYNDPEQNDTGDSPHLQDLFKFDKEVKVKANSEYKIKSKYKFDKTNLIGTKMAGVYISEKSEGKDNQINMKYNYAYPIVVRGNEKTQPKVNIEFEKFTLKEDTTGTLSLVTPFTNKNANYLKDSVIDVSLKDSKGNEVYGIKKKDIILTPESRIPYSTYITKELKPGTYTAEISIKNNKDEWTHSQSVTIDKKDEPESNVEIRGDSSNIINSNESNATPTIVFLVIIASLAIGMLIFVKRKSDVSNKE